jgi:hypothetical protein
MSSSELQETSLRMMKVTRVDGLGMIRYPGQLAKIFFMSRLARDLKIFPYGRNIGVVVSAVMEKDRQDAQRKKRRAPIGLVDPHREVKLARPSAKAATPNAAMPPPAAPATTPRPPSPPRVVETAVTGTGEATTELSVDDYLVGGSPCSMPRRGCLLLVSCLFFRGLRGSMFLTLL